jgi:glucokinase
MAFLGVDLGATKLCLAVFDAGGTVVAIEKFPLNGRTGHEVGRLVTDSISSFLSPEKSYSIEAIGIAVPGISRQKSGTVWAPNIPGWDDYPLLNEVTAIAGNRTVTIDSDRACYILGESWQGNAQGIKDAIYLAIGTGNGAGILMNGHILRGAHDIAGAIGWMTLGCPYQEKYTDCGFFEYHASGEGIAKVTREMLRQTPAYNGVLRSIHEKALTAADVFAAYDQQDPIAAEVLSQAVVYWGMAAANLISLFNPETIIFGGGVFGPAVAFLSSIEKEAAKWAQPIAATQVAFRASALGDKAGVYGAGYLAEKSVSSLHVNGAHV